MGLSTAERDEIKERLRTEVASFVAVFGSYDCDDETPSSDVDILGRLSETPTLFDLASIERKLGDLLGKPVELVTKPALSPHLRDQVNAERDVILA